MSIVINIQNTTIFESLILTAFYTSYILYIDIRWQWCSWLRSFLVLARECWPKIPFISLLFIYFIFIYYIIIYYYFFIFIISHLISQKFSGTRVGNGTYTDLIKKSHLSVWIYLRKLNKKSSKLLNFYFK